MSFFKFYHRSCETLVDSATDFGSSTGSATNFLSLLNLGSSSSATGLCKTFYPRCFLDNFKVSAFGLLVLKKEIQI